MNVYIAFSIHGTNAFITASKLMTLADIQQLGKEFTSAPSRRPEFNGKAELKLHWSELMTKEGNPIRSPAIILNRFKKLEAQGWKIDKSKFVERHYQRKIH